MHRKLKRNLSSNDTKYVKNNREFLTWFVIVSFRSASGVSRAHLSDNLLIVNEFRKLMCLRDKIRGGIIFGEWKFGDLFFSVSDKGKPWLSGLKFKRGQEKGVNLKNAGK